MVYNSVILCVNIDWPPCSVWPIVKYIDGLPMTRGGGSAKQFFNRVNAIGTSFVCIFSKKGTNKSIYNLRRSLSGFIHSQKQPLKSCHYPCCGQRSNLYLSMEMYLVLHLPLWDQIAHYLWERWSLLKTVKHLNMHHKQSGVEDLLCIFSHCWIIC